MRSPWQFISDLANRRRQRLAEKSSDPNADGGPDRLLLPAPSEWPEDAATNVAAESPPDRSASPIDKALHEEEPREAEASPAEPLSDRQKENQATAVAPDISSATQTATMPKPKGRAKRAAVPATRHRPDLVLASNTMPNQLPVERMFHDDVRSVDDDIKRLRAELAAKLRLQNEQLKKMLERFDRQ